MQPHYRKISAEQLHYLPASPHHPANTYFHFSFADYCDPKNMNYGVLRVLNDDNVKPHHGFDKHPHENMEIVSYVVDGKLTHWDSATDTPDTLERGHVQTVTAGTGVWHSELNQQDEWTRFLQIWIIPPAKGLPVRYENHKFELQDRQNRLLQIVGHSTESKQPPLHLHQDVNLYVSELTERSAQVRYALPAGRQVYINNFEGKVDVRIAEEGLLQLSERDSLEVNGPAELVFSAPQGHAHFILIEMPEMESS
ncbi:Pirin [hydrothermal vent metagenome]|uniref:Pirin n=1 Tax=hydrothermal vent metagenome TaxID=652676 RepID=A0A3B0YEY7_9ZZZZ